MRTGVRLSLVGLSIFLLDDEGSDVVTGLLVVFSVGSVTVGELKDTDFSVKHRLHGTTTASYCVL